MPTAFVCGATLKRRCDIIAQMFVDARRAFENGHIEPSTFHSVAELSALNLHSLFETFLEELFLSCLMGESGIEVERYVAPTNLAHAVTVVLRASNKDSEYLTWLPYDKTAERAA